MGLEYIQWISCIQPTTQTATPEVIAQQFDVAAPPLLTARYNIAPLQPVAAIRIEPATSTRQLVLFRWGLIPSWAKDPKIGHQCINAKAETVAEKPSFRAAFKPRCCLAIATAFYEWQVQGREKQSMWIGLKSHRPFAFAGVWNLGYCAAQCLFDGGTAAMVSIQHGRCTPIPFSQMVDPVSDRANVRRVDITAQS
jgi:putative SOS response-associated peptidase YedK